MTRLIGDNTKPRQELPESFAPVPDLLSFDVDEAHKQRVVEVPNKHHLNPGVNPARQKSLPNFLPSAPGLSLAA
ncbi:MAG: hypothetical protein HC869_02160 [Rhodospirillales bacterium]|nr:hypothetical protein [Rhodospirillales bacterium]